MSSYAYLSEVQWYLTRYGMTTYIILGSIGLFFNIMVFILPAYYRNPFSLYIFVASLCGLIGLNFSAVPVVYALDHPNPVTVSAIFCQVQFYFRHSFNQMMRTLFIFACVDRYAISSQKARIRSFSQYRIAVWITISVPIFWLIISIFPTMLNVLENGKCEGRKGVFWIILSLYITMVVGVIPTISMITFGILISKNLMNIRGRIQPTATSMPGIYHLRKRDREMIKMLLTEIIFYVSTTMPLSINLIYRATTQTFIKSIEQQRIEAFITYFNGTFLIYFNNSLPFWIYIIKSRSFRLEFKNVWIKSYNFFTNNQRLPMNN